jgi:hypothetical protein
MMTQRGRGRIEIPIRPVAAADIKACIKSLSELQRSPGFTQGWGGDWSEILIQEVESLARICYYDDETSSSDDPTLGFSVFVTAYPLKAQEKLSQALENWIRAQESWLEHHVLNPVFREKVIKRFKLETVYDDSLEGASDDRI